MDAKNIEAIYPVAPFQESLLLQIAEGRESHPARGLLGCVLEGVLDIDVLEEAWNQVIKRRQILRASFVWKRIERPAQVVRRELQLAIEQEDWRQVSSSQQEELLKDYVDSELSQPVDPTEAGAARLFLSRTAPDAYRLMCSYSRLLLDEQSAALLLKELLVVYDELCGGRATQSERMSPYRDHLARLGRQDAAEAETFWRTALEGFSSATTLAGAQRRGHPANAEEEYGQRQMKLSPSAGALAQALLVERELTLNTLLQGAWALLLSRYSGESEVIFGVTISARSADSDQTATMLGPLTNTLPMRVKVRNESVAHAWLAELQRRQRDMRRYQHNSLAQIWEWIGRSGESPLLESNLTLDGDASQRLSPLTIGSMSLSDWRRFGRPDSPLSLEVLYGDDPVIQIAYHRRRFDDETVTRMLRHLEVILEAISLDPEAKIGALPLLTTEEQRQMLVEWNGTKTEGESWKCAHELIEHRVEAAPDAIAVRYGEEEVSYRELNSRSNQLAHYLEELGIGPESRVGICLNRRIEMIVAVLGVWKAGAAYVPLDPTYPPERLAYMAKDARVAALISERELSTQRPVDDGPIISIDVDWERISCCGIENPAGRGAPENLAYIIYTSGSTGRPKGALIGHKGLCNVAKAQANAFGLQPGDRALQFAPLSFDASAFEIMLALAAGASLTLASREWLRPGQDLLELVEREQITAAVLPPSALGATAARPLPGLKTLIVAGEACPADVVRSWGGGRRFINAYGPTEATIWATAEECQEGREKPPIGRPIQNTAVYILDERRRLMPVGAAGELYIDSVGLARGYVDHPDLSAERFIPNPFSARPGERMYHTGDVCRYLPDGRIDFIGRKDHQVKLRGNRIELGEIEAILNQHAGVGEAVVTVSDASSGHQRLIAFVVPHRGQENGSRTELSVQELRSHLKSRLPDYLMPARFVILDSLPLTLNGKVDRKMLPSAEESVRQVDQEYVGARTPAEEVLVGIFKEVLKLDRVGIRDNFFELGGDSILSIQIISRANESGLGLTPKQLFQYQTIAELAAVAVRSGAVESETGSGAGSVPLTPIQQWFFEWHDQEPEHFNNAMMLEATEEIDLEALRKAVEELVKHHDALRHRFRKTESGWTQTCEELHGSLALETVDLSEVDPSLESQAIEAAAAEFQRGIDLSEGPLIKVVVFGGKGRRQRLLIIAHHLVIDGVSWRIVIGDLERGYGQAKRGEAIRLGPRTTSYKRWAERLKEEAQSERSRAEASYWLMQGERRVSALPVDMDGANTVTSSRYVTASLNEEETGELLQRVVKAFKTQIHEVLLSAVARSISEWSNEESVLIEVEGHGREDIVDDVDLTKTVGWFTSLYPVKVEVGAGSSLESLRNAKEQIREAGRRGVYYGMLRYLSDDADLREKLNALSRAQISFNYLGQLDLALKAGALFRAAQEATGEMRSRKEKRQHLIEINGSVAGGRLHLVWIYSEQAHRRETIEAVAERAMAVLREVIAASGSTCERLYTPSDFPLAGLDQQGLDRLIVARDPEDIYTLSPLQKAMLFHTLSGSNPDALFVQLTCSLGGRVDIPAFKRAWQRLADRHTILRSSFEWEDLGEPVQVVARAVELPIEYLDWEAIDSEDRELRFKALLAADRARGFDLTNPPLFRLTLIRLAADRYRLVWSHHHLLADGWSAPLILQEVLALYEAYQRGEDPMMDENAPYRDYIAWLKRQNPQQAEAYWRARLNGFNRPTKLWIDRGPVKPGSRKEGSVDVQMRIGGDATANLQSFGRQHHLTINTILQGAWAFLLSKYSGERDLVFGTTVSGRPMDLPGSESIIGPFINTLPVRVKITAQSSMRSWLSEIQDGQIEYGQYSYISMPEQYGEIPLGIPLYESILIFENYPVERSVRGSDQNRRPCLEITDVHSPVRTKYPLTVISGPGSELLVSAAYDIGRFDGAEIDHLLAHYRSIIESITKDPEQPVWSLSVWSRTERDQMLNGWKGRRRIDPDDLLPHRRLEAQVEMAPDAIAVVAGGEHLSYGALNSRANRLADYLQTLGVGPEVRVGVYLRPSPDLLVGLLGIIKAGGACVTIEPENHMAPLSLFRDQGASVLLTQRALVAEYPEIEAEIVRLDSDWGMIDERSGTNLRSRASAENLVFIAATSGSTGERKQVMVTHRGWRNHLLGMREEMGLTGEDRALQQAPLHLALSMLELFEPLLVGARLLMARPETGHSCNRLSPLMTEEKITTVGLTPGVCSLLLRDGEIEESNSLHRLILSGETMGRRVQNDWRRRKMDIHNVYRVSEASGAVAGHVCESQLDRPIVPVGRSFADTRIYLLDPDLEPVPAGVAGEVWIGGEGLARGYSDRPDLTAERFIPDPFSGDTGERIFGTGDLARCLPDGKIEVLARRENLIRTRFSWIEPAEIESALMEHPGIDQAAVLMANGASGRARLTAYLACDPAIKPPADALQRSLRQRVPAHAVPAAFLMMDRLPLTVDGRIDRERLAEIKSNGSVAEMDEPPSRELLSDIWRELFGVDEIGPGDNFFEMGGHSLLATRLVSRVREVFRVELPLRSVFEEPTIEGLALKIEKAITAQEKEALPPLVRGARDGALPLSFAQRRLWFIDQLDPGQAAYNCPGAMRLKGRLNIEALEWAIDETVRRHEVLRTRFEVVEGAPAQVIDAWRHQEIDRIDLTSLPPYEREAETKRLMGEEAATGFDLRRGPLLRVKVLKLEAEQHVALFTIHHIVSDAWSLGIFMKEIATLYEAFARGESSPLPELQIQYADYALWQRDYLGDEALESHLRYWKQRLGGKAPVVNLTGDRPRPVVPSYRGATKTIPLPTESCESLKALGKREGATLFMTLLAVFKTLLYRYTAESDLVVGTAMANRNRAEIEPLIGFFVNMLPLRTDLRGNPRFTQLLKRVKEAALGAYTYQDLPFERLVEAIQPERGAGQMPLFNIAFGVQVAPEGEMRMTGLEISPIFVEQEAARLDLTLWITESAGAAHAAWTYSADLFEEETIIRMHRHFETLLSSVVARPDAPLDEIEMLSEAERAQQAINQATHKEAARSRFKTVKPRAVALLEE